MAEYSTTQRSKIARRYKARRYKAKPDKSRISKGEARSDGEGKISHTEALGRVRTKQRPIVVRWRLRVSTAAPARTPQKASSRKLSLSSAQPSYPTRVTSFSRHRVGEPETHRRAKAITHRTAHKRTVLIPTHSTVITIDRIPPGHPRRKPESHKLNKPAAAVAHKTNRIGH
jgi:hypothetical protein